MHDTWVYDGCSNDGYYEGDYTEDDPNDPWHRRVPIPNEVITGEMLDGTVLSLGCRRFCMTVKLMKEGDRRVKTTPEKIAKLMGVSISTIYRWAKEAQTAELLTIVKAKGGGWRHLRLGCRLNWPDGGFTGVPRDVALEGSLEHQEAILLAYFEYRGCREDFVAISHAEIAEVLMLAARPKVRPGRPTAGTTQVTYWTHRLSEAAWVKIEEGRPNKYKLVREPLKKPRRSVAFSGPETGSRSEDTGGSVGGAQTNF